MPKALLAVLLLIGAVAFVRAQDATPTPLTSIRVANVSALAVSGDGQVLFVADATNNTLLVYDFGTRSDLSLLAEVALDGQPVAIAAADNYALVPIAAEDGLSALYTIAPDPFRAGDYAVVGAFDIPGVPQDAVMSPDRRWALITGDDWYSVVQVVSPEDNTAYPNETNIVPRSAALSAGMALLGNAEPPAIEQYILRTNQYPRAARTISLDAAPVALTVNPRMTLGAAALADGSLVLFDLANMQIVGSVDSGVSDLRSLAFIAREDGEWLLTLAGDNREISLYLTTDPSDFGAAGSISVGMTARFMTVYEDFLFVSDGRQISVFQFD